MMNGESRRNGVFTVEDYALSAWVMIQAGIPVEDVLYTVIDSAISDMTKVNEDMLFYELCEERKRSAHWKEQALKMHTVYLN